MHPFSQDANIALTQAQQRDHRNGPRRGMLSTSGLAAAAGGAGGTSGPTSNRLPTYIDYSKPGSAASSTVRDILSIDGNDDKYRKGGWRNRLIARANRAQGVLGALQRSSIRAGVLEQKFWWRLLALLLVLVLAALGLFVRSYETHIEMSFYSKNWVNRVIQPVPPLSGTCFASPGLQASYNATASIASSVSTAHAHSLVLNPGINMRFGMDCYHFSRQLPSTPLPGQTLPEFTIFHLYWRADLTPLGQRQIELLKSILVTQEPRDKTSIILWTNDVQALLGNPLLQGILPKAGGRLSVRHADFYKLATGTPMEGHALLAKGGTDARAWLDGDLVRVLVLYAYGGVWVDMDTLLVRSMYPLLEQEFVTQWDCYDKPYAPLNGAIMHFYARSPYLCEMLHIMATGPSPRPKTTDWGSLLYHQLHRRLLQEGIRPFAVLPYCLTDGRSCRLDNRLPDPFDKDDRYTSTPAGWKQVQTQVQSVFSIHLHNQWAKTWPRGGWLDKLVVQGIQQRWDPLETGG